MEELIKIFAVFTFIIVMFVAVATISNYNPQDRQIIQTHTAKSQ